MGNWGEAEKKISVIISPISHFPFIVRFLHHFQQAGRICIQYIIHTRPYCLQHNSYAYLMPFAFQ